MTSLPDPSENLVRLQHDTQPACFGCGPESSIGLRMEFWQAADGTVVCLQTIPAEYEGPKGWVHGGILATLLDETMSRPVRALGLRAVTRQMEIDYLRPVPSGAPIRLEGRITRSEGRKHFTEARLLNAEGQTLAQSKGLFLEIPRES